MIDFQSRRRCRCLFRNALAVLFLLTSAWVCDARPPEIRNLNLRGLQIGATTSLTIDGTDLLPAPRLFLSDQPVDAVVDAQSTPTRLVVSVPLSESTLPGIGQLRLATAEGFSNSLLVGLDRFPQAAIAEETASLPAALHGSVPGSGVSRTAFPGKANDELIVEVEAKRLGSKLRPVIHVYDSHRVQVAWGSPTNTLAGDARVTLKLPRDDRYTVEVHDAQYAPPGPSFFRLKIGQWQFADLAFPPAVSRGQDVPVDLLGNVAGLRSTIRSDELSVVPVRSPNPTAANGLPPSVLVSPLPEQLEGSSDQPTALPGVPIAVSGRLATSGERDRFLVPVQPGAKLLFEVFAERIGSRIDSVLEVRNKQNAVLASNDDSPNTTDSRLEFTVPADLDAVELTLRDNLDLRGEASIYRLVVTSVDSPQRQFDVTLKVDAINVASGELQVVEAHANRQAYDGPIQIQVAGLPPGMTVQGTEIPAGSNGTLLTFSNGGDAFAPTVTRLRAQSADGTIASTVRMETAADDRSPAWLHETVAIATTPKVATPFQVAIVNESSLSQLVLASKPTMTVKLTRPASSFGPIRLSLITSQPTPKVNGQPNQNLALRAEKPVEIPVDGTVKGAGDALALIEKQHADAVKQAAAAAGDAKVAADAKVAEFAEKKSAAETALRDAESKANYQTDYVVIVPASLNESSCDLSVRAELLNPERNVVLRTAHTPVRRLPVLNPLSIKLAGPPTMETTLDPKMGATVKIAASIERLADYKGDIAVTVAGLPGGVSAANVSVKADTSEFAVDVKIPANFAAAEISGLKLTATGPPDPQSGNIPVKSREVEVTIKVNKPAA